MSSRNQAVASNGGTQHQRAANGCQQTIPQHACSPYFSSHSLENPGPPINVFCNERSTPRETFDQHSWPEPPTACTGHADFSDRHRSPSGTCQYYDSQQLKANGTSSLAHVDAPIGHNPQYPYAASMILPQSTSQQQLFQPLSFGQPTEVLDFQGQLPKKSSPQTKGDGNTASHFGLLTPVSTYTQNSPSNEWGPGTVYNLGSESQQIWDSTFNAALDTNQASDGLKMEMSNHLPALPDEQSWRDFDFESLNSLFDVDDSTTSNQFSGSFNPVPLQQDAHLSSHWAAHHPDQPPAPLFDTFLTDTNYPDPDFSRISSEADMAQRGLHSGFMEQGARRNTASMLPECIVTSDTPSRADGIARAPARSSQENEAKNALLIAWKGQGMSYKEIKARGGFEEAESTLRGRYRTLTKPREERVRKPEWRDRDVSSPLATRYMLTLDRWKSSLQPSITSHLRTGRANMGQIEGPLAVAGRSRRSPGNRSLITWRIEAVTSMDIQR